MKDKIKTSIIIDRELWEGFKSKIGEEGGLKALSQAIEEAIKDEISESLIIKALEDFLEPGTEIPLVISPLKPKITTSAGGVMREMRDSRP